MRRKQASSTTIETSCSVTLPIRRSGRRDELVLRHFSKDRPQTRHGEAGCETETFAAIEKIRHISDKIHQPMAKVALAWLLHQPGVTSVIAGARKPDQIRQTAQAVDLQLSSETISRLNEATEEVKQIIGHNPDMWQSESRIR